MGQAAVIQNNANEGHELSEQERSYCRLCLNTAREFLESAKFLYAPCLQEALLSKTSHLDDQTLFPAAAANIGISFDSILRALYVARGFHDFESRTVPGLDDSVKLATLAGFYGQLNEHEKEVLRLACDFVPFRRILLLSPLNTIRLDWREIYKNIDDYEWRKSFFYNAEGILEKLSSEMTRMGLEFACNFSIGAPRNQRSFVEHLLSMPKDDGVF